MNEFQKRAILFGLLDVHRRLAELESVLDQALVPSPLSRYENDLSHEETAAVHAHFGRIRAAMLKLLSEAGIPLEVPRVGARWALRCGLTALQVAVAEVGPNQLLGYGPLSGSDRAVAGNLQREVGRLIGRVAAQFDNSGGRAAVGQPGAQAIVARRAGPLW